MTGILEEDAEVPNNRGRLIRPSALGDLLFGPRGLDPYLEEVGTLWLIHWQLAGTPMAQLRGFGFSITFPSLSSPKRSCSQNLLHLPTKKAGSESRISTTSKRLLSTSTSIGGFRTGTRDLTHSRPRKRGPLAPI